MSSARRRVLLAVDPLVLGSALATLLEQADQDDVVVLDLREGTTSDDDVDVRSGHFDAAVVTRQSKGAFDADVVIELADDEGGAGAVTVHHLDGHDERVRIEGVIDLVALLDEACAASQPRAPRLQRGT